MYSFPNLEPVCSSMSSSNCCFLTCIQISQEAGKVVWYSHLFKNFPVCCDLHSQRLLYSQWSRCFTGFPFFCDPTDVGYLISGYSVFSKTSLNIWKLMVHRLLKPGLENFEHDFTSVWKVKVKLKSLSPVWLFVTPWTVASQTSPLMWFSMQEYQSGLLFPPPGELPIQGSNLGLPHCRKTLYPLSHWEAYEVSAIVG